MVKGEIANNQNVSEVFFCGAKIYSKCIVAGGSQNWEFCRHILMQLQQTIFTNIMVVKGEFTFAHIEQLILLPQCFQL